MEFLPSEQITQTTISWLDKFDQLPNRGQILIIQILNKKRAMGTIMEVVGLANSNNPCKFRSSFNWSVVEKPSRLRGPNILV